MPCLAAICLEAPCTKAVHGASLWLVRDGCERRLALPCCGRLRRRRDLRGQLRTLFEQHQGVCPEWTARNLRYKLPVLMRREAYYHRSCCWRVPEPEQWPLDGSCRIHLEFEVPVTPDLRLVDAFQVYFRTAPDNGPWLEVWPGNVHAWLTEKAMVLVVVDG